AVSAGFVITLVKVLPTLPIGLAKLFILFSVFCNDLPKSLALRSIRLNIEALVRDVLSLLHSKLSRSLYTLFNIFLKPLSVASICALSLFTIDICYPPFFVISFIIVLYFSFCVPLSYVERVR